MITRTKPHLQEDASPFGVNVVPEKPAFVAKLVRTQKYVKIIRRSH